MKKGKDRFVYILMGLIMGFALGVSILFWQQSLNMTQMIFDKTKHFVVGLFSSEEHAAPEEKIVVNKKHKINKKIKKAVVDSTAIKNPVDTTGDYYSSLDGNYPDGDELHSDIYASLNNKGGDEVARDKFILKKQVDAVVLSKSNNDNDNKIDSLLIGGKLPKDSKNKFSVEFWESPLNYKGYKKNKNFLVLYGIKQYDQLELKMIKNDLYLCYTNSYYLLENTSEFKNLIPISNQQLINQLKGK